MSFLYEQYYKIDFRVFILLYKERFLAENTILLYNEKSDRSETARNRQEEDCMEEKKRDCESVTRSGNPRKPQGKDGEEMLKRMNESHFEVTGWALDFFEWKEDDEVLDIGCGGGMTLKRMSENICSGNLTGVDYSKVSVELSRKTNEEAIVSGKMQIFEASVEDLPFMDNQFDKIVTVESFYFWPDPVENLKEVCRVLKPSGTFLLVAEIYGKEGLDEKAVDNVKEYQLLNPTPAEFQKMFEAAGFSKIVIHTKEGTDWICVEGQKRLS